MKGRPSCRACGGREYSRPAEACGSCGDIVQQARDWLVIRGEDLHRAPGHPQDSHGVLFKAACWLVLGFDLGESGAFPLLQEYARRSDQPWSEGELRHKLAGAARSGDERGALIWRGIAGPRRDGGSGSGAGEPVADVWEERRAENARDFDPGALGRAALQAGRVEGEEWLARVSPVEVGAVTPEVFLSGLFRPGERVMVFTQYVSQGQYLYEVPDPVKESRTAGAWQLAPRRGEQARRAASGLPREGRCGVWFLCQPVSGEWKINLAANRRGKGIDPEYGRRHGDCVTRWPYMVLESDEPGVELEWLQFLCDLPVPIVALYTSGGRSTHALVRVDAEGKHDWDQLRGYLKPLLTKFGADRGVFSAVRLTRLPGCLRLGKEVEDPATGRKVWRRYGQALRQRLLYFDPWAAVGDGAISARVEVRRVEVGAEAETAAG